MPNCDRCGAKLKRHDHPDNSVDWDYPDSRQSYQFYQCPICDTIYGERYQYDSGTGSDVRWHRFQDGEEIKRHY